MISPDTQKLKPSSFSSFKQGFFMSLASSITMKSRKMSYIVLLDLEIRRLYFDSKSKLKV
jgi:hypothetical protein